MVAIYYHRNKINGKYYIGQTCQVEKELGIYHSDISKQIRGTRHFLVGGFVWKYAEAK